MSLLQSVRKRYSTVHLRKKAPLAGLVAGAGFILCLLIAPAGRTASLGEEPIVIRSTGREAASIAIPRFDPGRGEVMLKENVFSEVIYNNLEMTGYFRRGANQQFVEETHQADRKRNGIDFAEWSRLDTLFLVVGDYSITGETLTASVYLYYVPTGKRIFGKQFRNQLAKQRQIAHRIADEIFQYVTGERGVAGTQIAYVSTTDPTLRNREIWLMDADGANARALTNDNSLSMTPCWGAKGTEIYYTSFKAYNPDLCGIYVTGGAPWFITQFTGLNVSPSWSERRKMIALTLGKDGNSEIYTMNREGKDLRRLTYGKAIDSSPSWSPDGSEIVFTSDRTGTGNPQIYVMDADGLNVRRISNLGSTYCDGAAWSPKGDKIAFTAKMGGSFHIVVTDINGTNRQQLTFGPYNNEDPTWSPNGLMLAFASDRNGRSQIFVMNADGSNLKRLTTRGHCTSPAWSPFPTP